MDRGGKMEFWDGFQGFFTGTTRHGKALVKKLRKMSRRRLWMVPYQNQIGFMINNKNLNKCSKERKNPTSLIVVLLRFVIDNPIDYGHLYRVSKNNRPLITFSFRFLKIAPSPLEAISTSVRNNCKHP